MMNAFLNTRKLLPFVVLAFFLATMLACSKKDVAATTAKKYYEALFSGNSEEFVSGMYLPEKLPESYREQLIANAKMFVSRMNKEHDGVYEIRVINCETEEVKDSGGEALYKTANAFLVFCCGDSLNEEVLVPMVEHDGKWFMR